MECVCFLSVAFTRDSSVLSAEDHREISVPLPVLVPVPCHRFVLTLLASESRLY